MHTKALYAGSFDPMTLGHLNIIKRASRIFDELVIGVTVNLEKKTMFTFEERVDMIREVTKDMPNVTVDKCEGLLADFVLRNGFDVIHAVVVDRVDDLDAAFQQDIHMIRRGPQGVHDVLVLVLLRQHHFQVGNRQVIGCQVFLHKFHHGQTGDLSRRRRIDAGAGSRA